MWVRFSLSESDLAQLPAGRLGQKPTGDVQLILADGMRYPAKGRINFTAREIDPKLGTQQLRAEFANPSHRLLPGQFVRVRIVAGRQENVFLVPQSAVLQSEKGHFVFVDDNGKAAIRPVETGAWSGSDWIIRSGLNAGDRVIVDNLIKLRPGAPVTVAPPTAGAGPAPAAAAAAATPAPQGGAPAASPPQGKAPAPAPAGTK